MRLILWAAAIALLAGCASSAPAKRPDVVDANGKLVGEVIRLADGSSTSVVVLREGNVRSALRFRLERLTADGSLNYESSDCTGTPFMNWQTTLLFDDPSTLLASSAIAGPNRTVYVAVPWAKRRPMDVHSFSLDERCFIASFRATVVPVRPLMDLASRFTPPFTLRAER